MMQAMIAQPIGLSLYLRIFSKLFENAGSLASSNPISMQEFFSHAVYIKLTHFYPTMRLFRSSKTCNWNFHLSIWTLPFFLSSHSAYNSSTHSCKSLKILILQLHFTYNKVYPLGPSSLLSQWDFWEPNDPPDVDRPDLEICQDNWKSANQDPATTRQLIQQELDAGFIEEIPSISVAQSRWPKGIALGKNLTLFVLIIETLDLSLTQRFAA